MVLNRKNSIQIEILFWLLTLWMIGIASKAGAETFQPNILLIMADDLGWTDLSSDRVTAGNGSDYYLTPNIDSLAQNGVAFTRAYSCGPNCAPTRAALMSGQYAPRTGIYTVGDPNRGQARFRNLIAAENRISLDSGIVTLAERLQASGYSTGHFGKWHLGNDGSGSGPEDQGFDVNIGGDIRGTVSGGSRGHFAEADGSFNLPGLSPNGISKEFIADRLTTESIQFMKNSGTKPFFCYLTHFSVHTPIQSPEKDQQYFEGRAKGKRHRNSTYAGMLKNLDDNVGRILRFLENTSDTAHPEKRLIDDTLILFLSDNGGLGGYQEAGVPGSPEITNQYPLKSGKGSLYEGGIRTPAIIQWKGHIPAGKTIDFPVITLDWYPTLLAVASKEINSPWIQQSDGIDLNPWIQSSCEKSPDRPLFWHFPAYLQSAGNGSTWRTTPVSVIMRNEWKAHYYYETEQWELYDLSRDIGESDNLLKQRPEIMAGMAQDLLFWLKETNAALPLEKELKKKVHLPEYP